MDSRASALGAADARACRYYERALSIWPRLDRRALSRCACDPRRIARVVARRTSMPFESILSLIMGPVVPAVDIQMWFG
jgi:hypothetical protein